MQIAILDDYQHIIRSLDCFKRLACYHNYRH